MQAVLLRGDHRPEPVLPAGRPALEADFNLDLGDIEEDNGGKRVAHTVSRLPEAPLRAEPRAPPPNFNSDSTSCQEPKNPPACEAEGRTSAQPFLPAQA